MRLVSLLAGFLVWASTVGSVGAQEVDREQIERARELFAEGVQAARDQDWATAIECFERAYTLSFREPGAAAILLNLATAQAQARQPVEARRTYEQFLEVAPLSLRAEHRDRVTAALVEQDARIVHLRVPEALPHAVEFDGEAVDAGQEMLVNPGSHRVAVDCPAGALTAAIELASGPHELAIPVCAAEPLPDPVSAPSASVETEPEPVHAPAAQPTDEAREPPVDHTALHAFIVVGAIVLVAAGAAGVAVALTPSRPAMPEMLVVTRF